MKNKKILIACLIIIVLASITTIIYIITTNNEEDTPDYLIEGIIPVANQDILKDTTVDNLNITKVSLLTREGVSSFKATVSNNKVETIKVNKLYAIFYTNEEEKKILVLSNVTIAPNDTTYINITSETDLSKTTKIEYILEN